MVGFLATLIMNYKEKLEEAKRLYESANVDQKHVIETLFPELKESEDERVRKELIAFLKENYETGRADETWDLNGIERWIAWIEKQGKQKPILPKWKYKNDNTPLLRDSLILNKYGCVAKSPSGAFVNDVWVIDYDELAKLPKEELEKQGEQETLCDKCRKEHPSHSCQDITELGRCAVEHEQETDNSYCQENCKGFQETGRCFCDGECKAKKEYIEQNLQKNNFPQIEQKPAWSKEDDYNVQCLIAKVTYDIQKGNVGRNYKLIDWLKSLKKRMNNV